MNIYFLNPSSININSWKALLNILEIDCIIDLITYKSTAINPFTSNNQVFDDVKEKYNLHNLLPNNFFELDKEIGNKKYYTVYKRIIGSLIEKAKYYKNKTPLSYHEYQSDIDKNKDQNNILVLSTHNPYMINYFTRYLFGTIINKKICNTDFINLYKLDFYYRQNEYYDSYKWHDEYQYDTDKGIKTCEWMDNFFSELYIKYNISEKDFYRDEIYEKMIINRNEHDEIEINEIKQKEYDALFNDDAKYWDDELKSWDDDFPGWRWNID